MPAPHQVSIRVADMPQMLDVLDAMNDVGRALLPYVETDAQVKAALLRLEEKMKALLGA